MSGMRLQHRRERGLRFVRNPVGGLFGDHLDFCVLLHAVLVAVQPLDSRCRTGQALEHGYLAAFRQQSLGGVFARFHSDLVVIAADEGRVVLARISNRLAVELDDRDASVHGAFDRRRQRRRLERRNQKQIDFLRYEVVDLGRLCVYVAGAIGDLQGELLYVSDSGCQFLVDVLTIRLRVVGLGKADDEFAVLGASLDQRVGGLG